MNSNGPLSHPALRVPARRQAGGTVLGFLLGMLFGLAVALGVAVYITKVPLPFMNKNQPRPVEDAADPKKAKDWDPNTGLAGRAAPRPEIAPAADAPAADPAAAAAKSADPLGDLARSRSEPAKPAPSPTPATAPAAPNAPAAPAATAPASSSAASPASAAPAAAASTEPFQYFVQAGAYRTPEDAEQQRAKLSLMGLQPRVTERDQAGRMVYRVRLGPYERRDEADKTRERLDGSGIEAVVVRVQR